MTDRAGRPIPGIGDVWLSHEISSQTRQQIEARVTGGFTVATRAGMIGVVRVRVGASAVYHYELEIFLDSFYRISETRGGMVGGGKIEG